MEKLFCHAIMEAEDERETKLASLGLARKLVT